MFESFFPKPRLFFGSALIWALVCIIAWFAGARGWGDTLSLGGLVSYGYPAPLPDGAEEAAQATFTAAQEGAQSFWFWQYLTIAFVAFAAAWMRLVPHEWARWSVGGTVLIVFVAWFLVQLDVMINDWFGTFYDLVQKALTEPNSIEAGEYYAAVASFLWIAMTYVIVAVVNDFFSQHYVFRWRTAMNDRYMRIWGRVRRIEGASQRVQEDTMRFAKIMESLGVRLLDSVLTLIAFIPLLWVLSENVQGLPLIGDVAQPLVIVAIIYSLGGSVLLAVVGIKLPGLEFRIQREEAAYRKELVISEDDESRARPPTVRELFGNVRWIYFRYYLHYVYFNVARISYLQFSVMVPYIALGPTVVAAGFTLGMMQQIVRAFNRVEQSFQYLVYSWPVIVEMISIYKRLAAFERTIAGQELEGIELEALQNPAQ